MVWVKGDAGTHFERFCLLFFRGKNETQAESKPEPGEIGKVIEEVVDLSRRINLEVDSDNVQKLLDSHNQELTIGKFIEM
ncbi:hypothetical protein TNCV_2189691 [Trichonephila clavipes]|nr:hypothetical protein TNCV_2189691 [Trichonephila clavipes]